MQTNFITTSLLLAAIGAVQANQLKVNNWCKEAVTIQQSATIDGKGVVTDLGTLAGGNGQSIKSINFEGNQISTSIKIGREGYGPGVLQYEYTMVGGTLWYDLSDIDGKKSGEAGSPFQNGNVKVSPTGTGSGAVRCLQVKCPAGQVCKDAYNDPNDNLATFNCPPGTGDMWIDLCEPSGKDGNFKSRRELSDKHLRRHAVQQLRK